MSLVKWNPANSFFPSLSSWMDDFLPDNGFKTAIKGISIPAVNVKENKEAFVLDVAAPGFKKEEFKLEVKNGYLTISGESRESMEDRDETYTRREYTYNTFSRSFSLPENVNPDHIAAAYDDGVLKVTLPKIKADEKPVKQIAVN